MIGDAFVQDLVVVIAALGGEYVGSLQEYRAACMAACRLREATQAFFDWSGVVRILLNDMHDVLIGKCGQCGHCRQSAVSLERLMQLRTSTVLGRL